MRIILVSSVFSSVQLCIWCIKEIAAGVNCYFYLSIIQIKWPILPVSHKEYYFYHSVGISFWYSLYFLLNDETEHLGNKSNSNKSMLGFNVIRIWTMWSLILFLGIILEVRNEIIGRYEAWMLRYLLSGNVVQESFCDSFNAKLNCG